MNLFSIVFWACVVIDFIVPGVNISIGWYFLWIFLACIS